MWGNVIIRKFLRGNYITEKLTQHEKQERTGDNMISVFIADDEEDIIALVKKLIIYPQVKVIGEADNGADAYARILEKKPDLAIIDISMPKLSGLEVIEKVKKVCPDIAFVVISGYRDFEYAQSALRFGVSDYLLKPIKKQELNDILKKVDLRLQSANQILEKRDLMQKNINESRKLIRMNYVRQLLHSINDEPMEIPQIGGVNRYLLLGTGASNVCWSSWTKGIWKNRCNLCSRKPGSFLGKVRRHTVRK